MQPAAGPGHSADAARCSREAHESNLHPIGRKQSAAEQPQPQPQFALAKRLNQELSCSFLGIRAPFAAGSESDPRPSDDQPFPLTANANSNSNSIALVAAAAAANSNANAITNTNANAITNANANVAANAVVCDDNKDSKFTITKLLKIRKTSGRGDIGPTTSRADVLQANMPLAPIQEIPAARGTAAAVLSPPFTSSSSCVDECGNESAISDAADADGARSGRAAMYKRTVSDTVVRGSVDRRARKLSSSTAAARHSSGPTPQSCPGGSTSLSAVQQLGLLLASPADNTTPLSPQLNRSRSKKLSNPECSDEKLEKTWFLKRLNTDMQLLNIGGSRRAQPLVSPNLQRKLASPQKSPQVDSAAERIVDELMNKYRPQHAQVESWSADFDTLLNDPCGCELLLKFLKSEFSDENLEFLLACRRFKQTFSKSASSRRAAPPVPTTHADTQPSDDAVRSATQHEHEATNTNTNTNTSTNTNTNTNRDDDVAAAKALAEEIYATYLDSQAMREINLDYQTRSSTFGKLQNGSITADLFDEAEQLTETLLKKDSYPRFLRSQLYQCALENVLPDAFSCRRNAIE